MVLNNLIIPEFKEYITTPNNPCCKVIDTTRLMVEILWWLQSASNEFNGSELSNKLLIDWEYALVMRYKREKNNKFYPTCTLSFITNEDNSKVTITQLQWANAKSVSYRFHASFSNIDYYLELIEESFSKKWIYVGVSDYYQAIEGSSHISNISKSYEKLKIWVSVLNKKYGLWDN